jgi:xanthine dehydrogenase small subunit
VALVAEQLQERGTTDSVTFVSQKNFLPEYFSGIKERLSKIKRSPLPIAHYPFTYMGGGTDLYVQKHDELQNANIRFLDDEPGMKSIRKENNDCIMGPSVTVADLMSSPVIREAFPEFHRNAKLVSSTPIRNMATVAGNFVNASPIGDLTIIFLALDATLSLTPSPLSTLWRGAGGEGRSVSLRQFYKGYKQLDKTPEEYIETISFNLPDKNTFFNFEKVSKRTHLDIASVNSAICLRMNGNLVESAGLSAGGVGPVPMYLSKTSEYLKGKTITEATIAGAIAIMKTEISPISDARGSKEYKTLLLGQLIKAHSIVFMNQEITN